MKIEELQAAVDDWIKKFGVRYFDEKTNTLILMEEIGEFSRLISRKYGEQSFKSEEDLDNVEERIEDEMADIIFVVCCLANQMGIDLTKSIKRNIEKKTERDNKRHISNDKLKN